MSLRAFAVVGGIIAGAAFLVLLALGLCHSARDPDYQEVDVCAGYKPEDWQAHALTHPAPGGALAMAHAAEDTEAPTVPDWR